MERKKMQHRAISSSLKTRAEPDSPKIIEGYFSVFNSQTELWQGVYEEIAPTAFEKTMSKDVRALINHDTTLVLGRTKANTLELKTDSRGLYGIIHINEKDMDAMNLYERVQRGDVDQCSFGFEIVKETEEWREDGTLKWTVQEVELYEVSVCTFPAYEDTSVQARSGQYEEMKKRKLMERKAKVKERLKHGTESINDEQED